MAEPDQLWDARPTFLATPWPPASPALQVGRLVILSHQRPRRTGEGLLPPEALGVETSQLSLYQLQVVRK